MRAVILIITIALLLATKCEQAKAAYYAEGVFDPNLIEVPDEDKKPVPIPEEKIVLPLVPPGPQPEPVVPDVKPDVQPKPPVEPVIVPDLRAGELFVVATPSQYMVYDSPRGIVSVKRLKGPRDFFAKFADSANRDAEEERAYTQPFIYVIKAEKKGTVEIIIIPQGADDESQAIRHTLVVMGRGPQPPPEPEPDVDPTPGPGPGPDPIVSQGSVLILYETSDTSIPRSQLTQITSPTLREYLDRRCLKSADGRQPEYRIWDKDVDTTNSANEWRKAVEIAKGKVLAGAPLPILIVSNGTTGFSGPLPMTESETITLLKKYLGE